MTYSDRFQSRNLSIDAIAGFFIILMMFQHFNINTRAPYTLGHIFMFNTSWFFFKAGMFHRPQKLNKGIILKWSKRFLVPFMNFSVIGCLMQFIVEQSYDYDGNLLNNTSLKFHSIR